MQLLPVDPLLMLMLGPSGPEAPAASFERFLAEAANTQAPEIGFSAPIEQGLASDTDPATPLLDRHTEVPDPLLAEHGLDLRPMTRIAGPRDAPHHLTDTPLPEGEVPLHLGEAPLADAPLAVDDAPLDDAPLAALAVGDSVEPRAVPRAEVSTQHTASSVLSKLEGHLPPVEHAEPVTPQALTTEPPLEQVLPRLEQVLPRLQLAQPTPLAARPQALGSPEEAPLAMPGEEAPSEQPALPEGVEVVAVRAAPQRRPKTPQASTTNTPEMAVAGTNEPIIEAQAEPVTVDPIELISTLEMEIPELAAPMPKTVTVRIDEDLEVAITADGEGIGVVLEGAAEAVEPLREIGPELQEELTRAGFNLAEFSARERDTRNRQTLDGPDAPVEDAGDTDEATPEPRVIRGTLLDVIA
ncbi:MAG TPA: hypothetical protein QGF58_16420 [Myxococcota bacterium]|nr:hypothetical protein [Myxococcota bacterium]